jgi:hypothetical protein
MKTPATARVFMIALCAGALLGACGKSSHDADDDKDKGSAAKPAAAAKESAPKGSKQSKEAGLTLTLEQIGKLAVRTEPAATAQYAEESAGFGLIVGHEAIAQAVSDRDAAQASARFSQSALARAQNLQGTPGAMSADAVESLAQKAAVDNAALTLTTHRLSAQFGMNPPWSGSEHHGLLERIASGQDKLLRASFPLGALPDAIPHVLRAQRIAAARPAKNWRAANVWEAPADSSVPGRSFYALLAGADVQEGERLQVFAPIGSSLNGALVPESAVVMSDGRFWCYIAHESGAFARVEVDTDKPLAKGYFVSAGVKPGDAIVVHAAGQLLAKETGAQSDSDDEP